MDDSGSMMLQTDEKDPNGMPMSRWWEAKWRISQMMELMAYVIFPPVTVTFLNRPDVLHLYRSDGEVPTGISRHRRSTNTTLIASSQLSGDYLRECGNASLSASYLLFTRSSRQLQWQIIFLLRPSTRCDRGNTKCCYKESSAGRPRRLLCDSVRIPTCRRIISRPLSEWWLILEILVLFYDTFVPHFRKIKGREPGTCSNRSRV